MSTSTKKINLLLGILLLSTITFTFGQDIIGHYELNGNGEDSSGNSFNATVNGAIPSEDRFENPEGALFFDGINDYLEIPNQEQLNFGSSDFAVSLWLKTSTDGIQMLFHNGSSGNFPQYWLRIKDYSSADIDLKFITSNGIPTSPSVS